MFPVMSKASSSLCHLKRCISAKKNLQQQQQQERGVATHVLLAQRQATQLLKSAPYIRSNALKYGKSRDLLDVFRAYQAEDETSVNTSLELLQFVTNELHSKYAIRKKTERYSRARFIYHPLFWRPLLQNWKNAIIKHRNVPHPFKLRDFLYQIAMKLPGFDCSEGLLAILSVLEQQQQQQSFVSTAVLSTQILEDFLQFSTTINNRPKPPHVSVFHQVLLAWSRVPTTNHDPNAIRMKLQKFQHVVTLMEKHHIRPNAAIYNIFLQFYGEQKNDQRDAFRRKLDELMQNNVRPDHDTIQLVRTTLEKDDPWKQKFLYYIAVTQDPDDDDDHDEEELPNDDHKEETGDEEQEVEIIEKLQCDDVKDGNDDSVLHPKNSTAISSSHASKTLSSEEIPQQLADSKATEESEHLYNDDNSCRSSSLYPHDHENKNAWTISTHLVESLRTAVGNDREIARQLVDAAQIDWNRRIAQKEIHYQFNGT